MALAIAIGLLVAATGVLWVAVAREPGPTPEDVALAYEHAWDRLDFAVLFDLSGAELRDGMRRVEFVEQQRAVHGGDRGRVATAIRVDDVVVHEGHADVLTVVETTDDAVRSEIHLERRRSRWEVVGYRLSGDPAPG